jgi:5-methyltetrahydrofolate--homocysteine methyltransferase
MPEEIFEEISTSFSNLENSGKIQNLVRKALSDGIPALEILEKGMRVGLDKVGQKYEACEYFLSELLYAATIMNEVMDILKPELEKGIQEEKGKIVLGTVRGDIHDIGKNIFKMLAISSGFNVIDLGVDVEAEKFITAIKEMKADILALSALLTTTLPEIKVVVKALQDSNVREHVRVIIGGNAVTKEFAKEASVDTAALDAVEGLNICKEWMAK